MVVIGERVRQHRQERGLTQQALAVAAGCSTPTIERLEAGRVPKLAILSRVADALDVPLAVLVATPDRERAL